MAEILKTFHVVIFMSTFVTIITGNTRTFLNVTDPFDYKISCPGSSSIQIHNISLRSDDESDCGHYLCDIRSEDERAITDQCENHNACNLDPLFVASLLIESKDISFNLSYECKGMTNLACNFDGNNICNWKQVSGNDNLDWTLHNTSTPSSNTGPSTDHTSGNGYYIYLEASLNNNKTARISSGMITVLSNKCFQFWYHMYGVDMGQLNMYKIFKNGTAETIWHETGNTSNEWHLANVDLTEIGVYELVIEGISGKGFRSDIAVDDIDITECLCAEICNFETNWCDWHGENNTLWRRTKAKESLFGPSKDHTTYTGNGYYLAFYSLHHFETSTLILKNISALRSRCFKMWYAVYRHVYLRIYLQTSDTKQLSRSFSGYSNNLWKKIEIEIKETHQLDIVLEGLNIFYSYGAIAVDDITLSNSPCPGNKKIKKILKIMDEPISLQCPLHDIIPGSLDVAVESNQTDIPQCSVLENKMTESIFEFCKNFEIFCELSLLFFINESLNCLGIRNLQTSYSCIDKRIVSQSANATGTVVGVICGVVVLVAVLVALIFVYRRLQCNQNHANQYCSFFSKKLWGIPNAAFTSANEDSAPGGTYTDTIQRNSDNHGVTTELALYTELKTDSTEPDLVNRNVNNKTNTNINQMASLKKEMNKYEKEKYHQNMENEYEFVNTTFTLSREIYQNKLQESSIDCELPMHFEQISEAINIDDTGSQQVYKDLENNCQADGNKTTKSSDGQEVIVERSKQVEETYENLAI